VLDLFEEMTPSGPRPRLLVTSALRVPLSCGLWRPTVVVPESLCEPSAVDRLRWVFAHEYTHVERRDAWASFLLKLGQVVYYYLPWFWRLRKQVQLCQEYLADAAAVRAGASADYAQFLLSLSRTPAVPAGATGISGPSSDLFRRISMLLKSPVPLDRRCPRLWSLATAAGLVALAVVLSGIGLGAVSARDPEPKNNDPAKEQPKKDEITKPGGNDPNVNNADLQKKLEESEKALRELEAQVRELRGKLRANTDGQGNPVDRDKALQELRKKLQDAELAQQDELRVQMLQVQEQLRKQIGAINAAPGGQGAQGGFQGGQGGFAPLGGFQGGVAGVIGQGNFAPMVYGRQPHEGRLGVMIQKPSEDLVEQLDLPKGQGLVITQVQADSAAGKAGIKVHDILLEVSGKAVSDNPVEFVKAIADIKANTSVEVVVMRKGKKEIIRELTLGEAKPENPFGANLFVPPAGAGPNAQPQVFPFPQAGAVPLQVQNVPGIAARFAGANAGAGVMTTTFRSDDRFTTRHQEGSLIITVTGTVADGKAKTSEIQVQDGATVSKFESVDKVPEQYRDKVKNLVEMSEKGSVKVEIRKP
jgi:hypothetical protein